MIHSILEYLSCCDPKITRTVEAHYLQKKIVRDILYKYTLVSIAKIIWNETKFYDFSFRKLLVLELDIKISTNKTDFYTTENTHIHS